MQAIAIQLASEQGVAHAVRPVLMAQAREGRALDGTVLGWSASPEASHTNSGAF